MIRLLLFIGAIGVVVFAFVSTGVFSPAPRPLRSNARADLIVVEKTAHRLQLYAHGRVLRTYVVALGRGGADLKTARGDNRTPEGRYEIDGHKADSGFYRALHISYPSKIDRKVSAARGVTPGGAIMIHGLRDYTGWIGRWHRLIDWTDGCIALTDDEMDELWRAVPNGTPIEIRH